MAPKSVCDIRGMAIEPEFHHLGADILVVCGVSTIMSLAKSARDVVPCSTRQILLFDAMLTAHTIGDLVVVGVLLLPAIPAEQLIELHHTVTVSLSSLKADF